MRTLVACMTHIREPVQMDLLRTWYNLSQKLNPGVDYLMVDSASPICPMLHMGDGWNIHHLADDDDTPIQDCPKLFARFKDALGHPNYDAKATGAGSDRAWMKIFEIAIASQYDRLAYIEADVLFVRPIAEIFERMRKPNACAPMVYHGVFPETGLFFATPAHLERVGFVRKYNWRGPCYPAGEYRAWNILYESLQLLPLKGERNRFRTAYDQLDEHFPDGLDFLTHAYMTTQAAFLAKYGHADCWHA